jgi:hypothetical protein
MHEYLSVKFVDVAMMAENSVTKEKTDRISGMAFESAAYNKNRNSVPSQREKKLKRARKKSGRKRKGTKIRLLFR